MAARDVIVKYLGEKTARAIERFVAALLRDSEFVDCTICRTPIPANLVSEWGCCPKCRASSEKLTTDALVAQWDAAPAVGEQANNEAAEIERKLSTRQGQ